MSASPARRRFWQAVLEIALVFAVFYVHGARPAPDVGETNYLSKAEHFWNPKAFANDFYCNSGDAQVIYFSLFGWLTTLGWSRSLVVWVGRILSWLLLAIAWRGLSRALLPRAWWFSVLSSELFVLLASGSMAGEWIIGGVEAKVFSYALVLWGVHALVLGRWNLVWLLLGAATALHPLVGGWSLLCAGVAWLITSRRETPLWSMFPGLLGGVLLAAPGIGFALVLSQSADAETMRQSNLIQLYERLPHHLLPLAYSKFRVVRHLLQWPVLLVLWRITPATPGDRRLRWFVATAMSLAAVGLALGCVALSVDHNSQTAAIVAAILRFYWFRLGDVIVPVGGAIVWLQYFVKLKLERPATARWYLTALVAVAVIELVIQLKHVPGISPFEAARVPRADVAATYDDWRDVCRWAADQTPPGTLFLTPRTSATFKWYSGRDEVITWKDMPQDAVLFVQWRRRVHAAFDLSDDDSKPQWCRSISQIGIDRLRKIATDYGAQYAVVELVAGVPRLPIEPEFENTSFAVYRIDGNSQ